MGPDAVAIGAILTVIGTVIVLGVFARRLVREIGKDGKSEH